MTPLREVLMKTSSAKQTFQTTLFYVAKAQKNLNQVVNWFEKAGLVINMERNETEFILVSSKGKYQKYLPKVTVQRSEKVMIPG